MRLIVEKTDSLQGSIEIPASKSHTIRAVIIASLAEGTSVIKNPLTSEDTKVAVEACKALGADIKQNDEWIITGFGGKLKQPQTTINMLNSGTSAKIIMAITALGDFKATLDGDASLRKRPMQPLIMALNDLGAEVVSVNNNGCLPAEVQGPIKGGKTQVDGISSQYITSLLIACPLAEKDTEVTVTNLHEVPYVKMTMQWLDKQGIKYKQQNFQKFKIFGNQKYKPFEEMIAADWSSATFPICAACIIPNSDVLIKGLDINDVQGDKAIIDYLKKMGANITIEKEGIRVKGSELHGTELDLKDTPDALPMLAVVGCFAKGTTKLVNVAQARIKETDRIRVMCQELSKMGADIRETQNGLIAQNSQLKPSKLKGHHDHRAVMALTIAGLAVDGKTEIDTAESISVTYPTYIESMKKLGAKFQIKE